MFKSSNLEISRINRKVNYEWEKKLLPFKIIINISSTRNLKEAEQYLLNLLETGKYVFYPENITSKAEKDYRNFQVTYELIFSNQDSVEEFQEKYQQWVINVKNIKLSRQESSEQCLKRLNLEQQNNLINSSIISNVRYWANHNGYVCEDKFITNNFAETIPQNGYHTKLKEIGKDIKCFVVELRTTEYDEWSNRTIYYNVIFPITTKEKILNLIKLTKEIYPEYSEKRIRYVEHGCMFLRK